MKSFLKNNLPLIAIILLAVALRFIKLGTNPIGFNDDESAFGYNAYSIIKTARDEWGRLLPFPVFESFGDWKLVGYLYLVVISQVIFGVNEFATRFPSALVGVLAVGSTYLLTKKLFDKKTALVAAFLLAISPWHIIASRNAFESDILIFFITAGTYLFLEGLQNKKYLPFSLASFVTSFYIYRSSWLFVPLFLSVLYLTYRGQLKKIKVSVPKYLIISIIFLLPLLPTALTFRGQSRFLQESFISGVSKIGIINEVNEKRGECLKHSNTIVCATLYNKYASFFTAYVNNYFENLSPGTYFTKGTANGYQSFSNRGFFYSFELPLLVAGIVGLLIVKNPSAKVLFAWILIVPIGASITGIGNPGRLNILMPAVQIVEAYGFFYLWTNLKKLISQKLLAVALVGIIGFPLSRLITDMFFFYPQISGISQRYGYKELFQYLESQRNNYSEVAVSRKADDSKQYIHYLFFNKIDPFQFIYSSYTKRHRDSQGWATVEQIGNVKFYPGTPPLGDLPPQSLIAVGNKEVQLNIKPVKTVYYPNGDTFFEVYNVYPIKAKVTNEK